MTSHYYTNVNINQRGGGASSSFNQMCRINYYFCFFGFFQIFSIRYTNGHQLDWLLFGIFDLMNQ
jgi:hypothetical protein